MNLREVANLLPFDGAGALALNKKKLTLIKRNRRTQTDACQDCYSILCLDNFKFNYKFGWLTRSFDLEKSGSSSPRKNFNSLFDVLPTLTTQISLWRARFAVVGRSRDISVPVDATDCSTTGKSRHLQEGCIFFVMWHSSHVLHFVLRANARNV